MARELKRLHPKAIHQTANMISRPVICAPPEFGGGVPLEVPRTEDQGHLSVPASPRSVKECTRTDRWSS